MSANFQQQQQFNPPVLPPSNSSQTWAHLNHQIYQPQPGLITKPVSQQINQQDGMQTPPVAAPGGNFGMFGFNPRATTPFAAPGGNYGMLGSNGPINTAAPGTIKPVPTTNFKPMGPSGQTMIPGQGGMFGAMGQFGNQPFGPIAPQQ